MARVFHSIIPEIVKKEQIGVATGLSMIFNRIGMLLAPPIFGYIVDNRGSCDLSWFILGFIFLLSSISQYLYHRKIYNLKK